MIAKLSKRYALFDLLRDAESVEALNVQTALSRGGDFVGCEDVFRGLEEDQSEQRGILLESFLQSTLLRKPENECDYDALVVALDELLEMASDDEFHPLMSLVDIIGDWIAEWDHKHHPMREASGAEVLGYMMREHGLNQSDLPDVGPQSVVSEILSGRRQLNLRQSCWLAEHFKVPVDVFI
jgi:HTH-type transcriptional regulator/antitoxin HigA